MLKRLRFGKLVAWSCALFLSYSFLITLIFWFAPIPFTPHMVFRKIEYFFKYKKSLDIRYQWENYTEISDKMALAVIASEDQFFLDHKGFDFKAIKLAIEYNKKGKKIRGGSTISQQVAKNVFLWHGRSWFRKVLEAWFTLLIEVTWGKKRIMEVYLNIIELGEGVFGVKAAAKEYFRKSPFRLNRAEAASLAAVLPNPLKFSVKKPSNYVLRRRGRIQLRMSLLDVARIKSIL